MADWTTVEPIVVSKRDQPSGASVTLRFTDDTAPTPNTVEKRFDVRNSSELARQAFDFQAELNAKDAIPASGSVTPVAPTSLEQAVADANEARRKLRNLNAYQVESGKTDLSTLGTSGITIGQARASLVSDAEDDITNATRLNIFVDQTR